MERELLLLGLLRQQEMHGYQLHEFIDRYLQTCVDIKKSTAYYLLDKLAQGGFVTQTAHQKGNRPPRRVYRLTPAGETHFQELLRQNLAAHLPVHLRGDVGVAFLDQLPGEEAVALLQQRQERMNEALAAAQQVPPHAGSMQLIIAHHVAHLKAEIAWLDALIARLINKTYN